MSKRIKTLPEYLQQIQDHVNTAWTLDILKQIKNPANIAYPERFNIEKKLKTKWFRGQPEDLPLLPKVLRKKYDEPEMILDCRRKVALIEGTPEWDDYASWLWLMQHHNLPTRLLDWTESSTVALFFALEQIEDYEKHNQFDKFNPVVWLLNPNVFNWVGFGCSFLPGTAKDEVVHDTEQIVPSNAYKNIIAAFNVNEGIDSPVACSGRYVHMRMQVQNSRFIVWGKDNKSIKDRFSSTQLFMDGFIKPFFIDKNSSKNILEELKDIGISRATLFPEFEGIAVDLEKLYRM